jgi:hypothetical protein
LIYFAVMGNITALQRFVSTFRWFKKWPFSPFLCKNEI